MTFDDIDYDKVMASPYKEEFEILYAYIDDLESENNQLKEWKKRLEEKEEIDPVDIYGLPGWDY